MPLARNAMPIGGRGQAGATLEHAGATPTALGLRLPLGHAGATPTAGEALQSGMIGGRGQAGATLEHAGATPTAIGSDSADAICNACGVKSRRCRCRRMVTAYLRRHMGVVCEF